jgi:hypothetical protein
MKQNMGRTDRLVRALLIAPVLLVIAFLVGIGTIAGLIATVLAVVMLATAVLGYCPLYAPFHFRTNGQHQTTA